ncbi:hypothetical protein TNCV_3494491 [Trichonephila clavipes]|nr:hypothetical protein TNCV_3494491 [Trichonephila clavipes]
MEEYRSDDERHVELQSSTDLLEKYASTAKVCCCLDHNMFETETVRNTSIPLHPFHLTPPFLSYITGTCSK